MIQSVSLFVCCDVRQRTLFDLLGPIIDPIGYQIELETYVAKIMRGPSNLYISLVGYLSSASVFFHFFVDPHQALTVRYGVWLHSGESTRVILCSSVTSLLEGFLEAAHLGCCFAAASLCDCRSFFNYLHEIESSSIGVG